MPIVILPYLDEYRKHRTGTDKTAGMYFSLLNFDRTFLCSNMESISLLGNSKTNLGQFNMAENLKNELNEISGKSLMVYNAHTDSEHKIRILIGPWVWDSVQRWFSLYLESMICSRCKCPKLEFCKCPSTIDIYPTYTLRRVEEAKQIQKTLINGEQNDGYKYVSMDDIEIRDMKIDAKSKAKKTRESHKKTNSTQKENPYYEIKGYDILQKSIVDIMHGEGQGDLRKHLTVIFEYFHYTNILEEFQKIVDKYPTCKGKPLKMKVKDYKDCSFDHFLEFVVYSVPILYEFLIDNEIHADTSFIERKKHVVCWSNHVSYVLLLIQDSVGTANIELSYEKYFHYRKQAIELYGEETFLNPNFHWNSHIFSDCKDWGNARFFWALLFELKHKQFKQFNDSSNHKNLEKRGAYHEKLQRQIKIDYPWIRDVETETRKKPPLVLETQQLLFKTKLGSLSIGSFIKCENGFFFMKDVFAVSSEIHPVLGFMTLTPTNWVGKVSSSSILGRCVIYQVDGVSLFNQYSFFLNFHKINFK